MACEGEMADDKQPANNSADHHDPDGDSACRDTQLAQIEPHRRPDEAVPATFFHRFSELPWELRRLVWEFALPRSVYTSEFLWPEDCVPYPPMGRACREARLVATELGSMVTAWNCDQVDRCWDIKFAMDNGSPCSEDLPDEADMCVRTWFSSKLDTLVLSPMEDLVPFWRAEHSGCDFIDLIGIGKSSTTRLVVRDDLDCSSDDLEYLYEAHLKGRAEVLLVIEDFHLTSKDQVRDNFLGLDISRPGNRAQIIRLDDTVALTKWIKLWVKCCQFETCASSENGEERFGEWLYKLNTRQTRTYDAWVVQDQAYEKRLVSPEAHFLLHVADSIISNHESVRNTGPGSSSRGHEIMDDKGMLKKDHPIVQELDIKLPLVKAVYTVSILGHCYC